MPQTTSNVGRLSVAFPDRAYDAQIDGGVALHAALTTTIKTLSDNITNRWFDNFTLTSSQTTTLTHNFTLALSSLKVLIMESGVLKTQTEVSSRYVISQVSTSAISIQNVSGGSISNIQVYIIGYPLGVKSADLDASIDTVVSRLRFTSGVLLNEMAAPSTPSSGQVAMYAKSDKKIYTKDSNGVESQVGSGSSTGINYFSNSDLENGSTSGISTYKDAAQSTPVDGTGGSPTVTIAASNSSPLRGTYSLVITKPASNVQGEGVAFDLTVPTVDSGKTVQAIFDITNPNLTSGDITLNLYDVTNSVLVASSIVLPTGTSSQYTTALNLSTGISYRLCLHFATTSTTAATIKMDSIIVTPKITPIVAGISDWIAYIPSLTGFTSPTSIAAEYRRVGDSIEVQATFGSGTPAASLASISLPTNLLIDSTKISLASTTAASSPIIGQFGSVGANGAGSMVACTSTSTSLVYFGANYAGSATLTPVNGNAVSAAGVLVSVKFIVPIANQSSNITLASTSGAIEYASNSSSTDADDTTSFVAGAAGSVGILGVTNPSAQRKKRVQLSAPIQPTDRIQLEFNSGGNTQWVPMHGAFSGVQITGFDMGFATLAAAGVGLRQVSSTQIDVEFGTSLATISGIGSANWSSVTASSRWRVAKYSAIGGAELAPATITTQGIVGGSQISTSGIIATDFTGLGTPTAISIFMQRDKDRLILTGGFTTSTPTAVTAKMLLPLVNGTRLTIDTTKIITRTATPVCHLSGKLLRNITANAELTVLLDSNDNTSIYFSSRDGTNNPLVPQLGNVVFGSTEIIRIDSISIPITGWN